ncbi:hypothetical protein BDZ94DRAFT_1285571 [Collybia nuda]|uniref:SPRY-domain-containing protein n=1 Tax=Collybia nuda TaxID=64659 RepID=A0A9P5XW60_9AGAR|nr:hypothetical protein BDZ94DRAFT_1285571 [Collybia nuda]
MRPRPVSTYEPRIVRAGTDPSRNIDAVCPPSSSTSSVAGGRATSTQRQILSQTVPTLPSPSVSFARPAYLEHSALRHMLQTDAPPALPPSRKVEAAADAHSYTTAMSPTTDSDDESNVSPPRELPSAPPPPPISQDQVLKLPTRWSEQFRHSLLSVSDDGRDLTYHGTSCSGDRDAAAARTINPIPAACGVYYYEVTILSKGQKGFAGRDVKLSRLPGWEPNSWGYHGDDGFSFSAERAGTPYGPTFGTGDVIGCGIDFTTHKAFFTKNGSFIGAVFDNISKDTNVYPSVGLRHAGEAIRVNFGHEPFKYDIDFHVQQQRNLTWANILSTPLDSSLLEGRPIKQETDSKDGISISNNRPKVPLSDGETKSVINKLILSYLAHHGYAKTVRSFQKQQTAFTGDVPQLPTTSSDSDIHMSTAPSGESSSLIHIEDDIERRTKIVNAVLSGDIDTAMTDTKAHHPAVLEAEEGLILFKLRCRKFVELILDAAAYKKQMKNRREDSVIEEMDGIDDDVMGMDVDEEGPPPQFPTNGYGSSSIPIRGTKRRGSTTTSERGWSGNSTAQYEAALNQAISYGQSLSTDYKNDSRSEVRQIFKRTFAIVAWEDPMAAGGVVSEVVGQEARNALANELNQAILKSQGRPSHPVLETMYRHTATCVVQLGLLGVGSAAFADMPREFLEG